MDIKLNERQRDILDDVIRNEISTLLNDFVFGFPLPSNQVFRDTLLTEVTHLENILEQMYEKS